MLFFSFSCFEGLQFLSGLTVSPGIHPLINSMKKLLMLLSAGAALAFVSCASAPPKKDCCGTCKSESTCKKGCDCDKCQK